MGMHSVDMAAMLCQRTNPVGPHVGFNPLRSAQGRQRTWGLAHMERSLEACQCGCPLRVSNHQRLTWGVNFQRHKIWSVSRSIWSDCHSATNQPSSGKLIIINISALDLSRLQFAFTDQTFNHGMQLIATRIGEAA